MHVATAIAYNHFVTLLTVVRRIPATIVIGLVTFFIGLGSALNIDILINQVCMKWLACLYECIFINNCVPLLN